jgi:putative phosphoesterase
MKILFFSDVHGSPESLELLLEKIRDFAPDHLVLLGDALYHGPRNPLKEDYAPKKTAELLNSIKARLTAVRGNCDSEVDQMMLEYPMMSDYAALLADGHRFFLTHGHHWNPGQLPPLGSGDVLCYGHTHIPQAEKITDDLTAFNPGSLSLPKGGYAASYGTYENNTLTVLELESGKIIFQTVLS